MTVTRRIYLAANISGGRITLPLDFDLASSTIYAFAAGGHGDGGATSGYAGGGGEFRAVAAPSGLSAGGSFDCQIGVGGGGGASTGDTYLKNVDGGGGSKCVSAVGGNNGSAGSPNQGKGGTGGAGAAGNADGGAGHDGHSGGGFAGGGGGGAGGPNGAGGAGGGLTGAGGPGGGGGGGDGGSAGSNGASVNPGGDGGGTGFGAGGSSAAGANATANTAGGGGGGGWSAWPGGNGASKNTYTDNSTGPNNGVSIGPGGGGGGAGGSSTDKGGNGGYAAGGGGGTVGANSGSKGLGGDGFIVVEYTASALAFTAVVGALSLTGQTVTFTNQGGYTVVKGDLTLSGKTVTFGTNYTFTVTQGDLLISGKSVGVNNGGVNFNTVAGSLSLSGGAVSLQQTLKLMRIAPYAAADSVGTKSFQIYQIVSGVLTPVGSPNTTAFQAIPHITNGWFVEFNVVPNGAFGDFAGIAVFTNINGSQAKAIELYSPPTLTPSSLVIDKIAGFLTTDVVVTPGYQLYDSNGGASGSHVTSGILAIPGVTNGWVTQLTMTPDSLGGAQNGILWDGG